MTTPIPDDRFVELRKKLLDEVNKTRDEGQVVVDPAWPRLQPPPKLFNEGQVVVDPKPHLPKLDEGHVVVVDRFPEVDLLKTPPKRPKPLPLVNDIAEPVSPPKRPIDEELPRRVPRVPRPPEPKLWLPYRWVPELPPPKLRLPERTRRKRVQPLPA